MELEKILNDYLQGKEIIKENMNKINDNLDEYEDEEEEYEDDDDDEEDEEDEEDESEEIDIETITDIEKMKIVCNILDHIENDYPNLEKIIMSLQDIIEEHDYS